MSIILELTLLRTHLLNSQLALSLRFRRFGIYFDWIPQPLQIISIQASFDPGAFARHSVSKHLEQSGS